MLAMATGCMQQIDFSPLPEIASIVADADVIKDVELTDENGELHPARLYYQEDAEPFIENLVASVTILPKSYRIGATGGADLNAPDDGAEVAGQEVERDAVKVAALPYIYIRVGSLDDDGRPRAWRAPYSAMGMTSFNDPIEGQIDASPGVEGAREGSATEKLTYNWWLTSGSSGTGWTAVCASGGEASQTTYSNSFGDGKMELWREQGGINYLEVTRTYSGAGVTKTASDTAQGKYRVVNEHMSGYPVGGNGNYACQ